MTDEERDYCLFWDEVDDVLVRCSEKFLDYRDRDEQLGAVKASKLIRAELFKVAKKMCNERTSLKDKITNSWIV